jgi:hypothetical protein
MGRNAYATQDYRQSGDVPDAMPGGLFSSNHHPDFIRLSYGAGMLPLR